jgi:hypothetical protein
MNTTINDQLNEIFRRTDFRSHAFERALFPVMKQIREALVPNKVLTVSTVKWAFRYPGVYRMIGPVELDDKDTVIEDTLKYGISSRDIAKRIRENMRSYFYYLDPSTIIVRAVYIQEPRMRQTVEQRLMQHENVLRKVRGLPKLY